MALLTAAELKSSREAVDAGVDSVTDADATLAISEAESVLYSVLGYKVQTSDTSVTVRGNDDGTLWLPLRGRTVSAVTVDSAAIDSDSYRFRVGGFVLEGSRWARNADIVVTGTFGYASTDRQYILAKRAVKLLATRILSGTSDSDDFPSNPNAYLTSYNSEGASFTFFTPEQGEEGTGYQDVDLIVAQIGKHPLKNKRTLKTAGLRSTGYGYGYVEA